MSAITSPFVADRDFSLMYEGEALADGRMDVRDLAPALMALGDLLRDANDLLDPDSPEVSLEIRANPERGSFLVHLVASLPDLTDRAVDLFRSREVSAAATLATLAGAVFGASKGVFWVIKKVGDRQITAIEQDAGGTTLVLDDGTTVLADPNAELLYRSVTIRQHARKVIAPLRRSGVDALRVDADSEPLVIREDDVPAFDAVESVESTEHEVAGWVNEMMLLVEQPAFNDNKWRFHDGGRPFAADLIDDGFRHRVDDGKEAFRSGDTLRCRVRFRQWRSDDGRLRTSYAVEEVLEHIPRQVIGRPTLDLPGPDLTPD